jgi:hypothetical protein
MNRRERREEAEWKARRPRWTLSEPEDDRPSDYERANQSAYLRSNGRVGMRIVLSKGVFWSRGWRGCPQCGGDVTTHKPNKLYLVIEGDYMRIGWSCTGQPGKWEN